MDTITVTFQHRSMSKVVSVASSSSLIDAFIHANISRRFNVMNRRHVIFSTPDGEKVSHNTRIADLRDAGTTTIVITKADTIFIRWRNHVIAVNVTHCLYLQDVVIKALGKGSAYDWRYCHLFESTTGPKIPLTEEIPDLSVYQGIGSTATSPYIMKLCDTLFIRFGWHTDAVNVTDCVKYSDALSKACSKLGMSDVKARYCHLFESKSGPQIPLTEKIPDLSEYQGVGSTVDNPMILMMKDTLSLKYIDEELKLNVGGCLYFRDLVPLVQDACRLRRNQEISFTDSQLRQVGLHEQIPSLLTEDAYYTVTTGLSGIITVDSGADLDQKIHSLIVAGLTGVIDGLFEMKIDLIDIDEGTNTIDFIRLPDIHQWDAVIYDEETSYVYMAEPGYEMTRGDFFNLKDAIENRSTILRTIYTGDYRNISPDQFNTIIAHFSCKDSAEKSGYIMYHPSTDRYVIALPAIKT